MTESEQSVARMRLRVALHGLLLALEGGGQFVLERPLVAEATARDLATTVTIHAAGIQDMLSATPPDSDPRHEARVDAMRDAFRTLMRAHRAFEVADDRQAAARALLATLSDVTASARNWRDD